MKRVSVSISAHGCLSRCRLILAIIFIFFTGLAKAQTTQGTDFWLTPMMNYDAKSDSFFVIVSAEKATAAKVEIPLMGFSQSITLGYNDLIRVYIPATYKPQKTDTVFQCGIHVTSFLPVSVYSLSARSATTDASCIFPSAVQPMGGDYYALTPKLYTGGYNSGNTIGIVCIDDSAVIQVTPTVSTGNGHVGNKTFSKKLYQGEVFLFSSASKVGLEGTYIKSAPGKRIAVFSGDICVAIRCAACDHVYEEMPPISTLGKNFIVTPFFKQDKGHDFQVVATENSTTIKENNVLVATLNAGQVYYRKVYGDSSLCLTSDKPVLLAQYMIGKSCNATVGGDPAMLVINPLEQTIRYAIVSTSNTTLVKTHYINIIVPKAGLDSVYLDGSLLLPTQFDTLSCGNYFLYRDTVLAGNHRVECRFGFICYLYGIGTYESYAYSAGSGLKNLQRYILSESYPSCDSGFIVKLASFGDSATRFKWTFNNTQKDTVSNPFFYVKTPGVYPVKLLYKLLNKSTWDSTAADILVEKPKYTDFITFDKKTVCDTQFRIDLPNTPIFSYKWNTGDTTAWLFAKKTGTYKVAIHNRITGCDAVDSCALSFYNKVQVKMSYKMARFCPGIPLYLYDSSKVTNDSITAYHWYADKYPLSKQKNDTIKSPRANSYEIKLVIFTANGCIDSTQEKVFISDVPVAVAGVTKYDSCYGRDRFRFNNGSYTNLGKITRLKWMFGDGDTSAKLQAFKSYKDSGTYNVRLIAFSETGCFDTSDAIKVTVYPTPRAGILIADSAICLKNSFFDFRNGSAPDSRPMQYLWNWGDGTGSTYENPGLIQYYDTGTFHIRFTASFKQTACGDTAYRNVTVIRDPVAAIIVDSSNFCLNKNYYAFTSTSKQYGKSVPTLTWYWGDGNSTIGNSPITHRYTAAGTFKVKMVYNAGKGCVDSIQKNVIVYNSPKALFAIVDSNACGNANYFKIANNSTAPGNAKWDWQFGDGTSSTVKNPADKNYATYGSFEILLAVKDPLTGCIDTAERNIKVLKAPSLNISASDSAVCYAADSFVFTDSTDYGNLPAYRKWIFEDGTMDTTQRVVRTFLQSGFHNVTFAGGIPGTCADTLKLTVHVRYSDTPITASFQIKEKCAPAKVDFIANTKEGKNWSYTWTDVNSSKTWLTQNVSGAVYNAMGSFPVTLTAKDDIGCSANAGFDIVIAPQPSVEINNRFADSQCFKGNVFGFNSTLSQATLPVNYNWNTSPNAYTDSASPNISYSTPGLRTVSLIITDGNNCKDTGMYQIRVYPNLALTLFADSGCVGETKEIKVSVSPSGINLKSTEWFQGGALVFSGNPYRFNLSIPGIENIWMRTVTENGCVDTSNTVIIKTFPKPIAKFGIEQQLATGLGVPVIVTDSSVGADQWIWEVDKGVFAYSQNYNYLYPRLGDATVRLIVLNNAGCADTATKKITLLSNEYGWIPGAFSPDGNGTNDVFKIEGLSAVSKFEMVVYNRWGELLFKTNDPNSGWDGNYLNKPAPSGVYAYRINLIFYTGKKQVLTGEVTLLR